jgi:hypothetical protein
MEVGASCRAVGWKDPAVGWKDPPPSEELLPKIADGGGALAKSSEIGLLVQR